jgi:hypothetical protein
VGSLENLAGGEILRRTATAPVPSPAPVKSPNRTVDEWEQKLYGKQGKGKLVGCCPVDHRGGFFPLEFFF